MLLVGVLIFIPITLLPGFLAVRLLRKESLPPLNALLYAVGLGLVFNILVGAIANFTLGINLFSVVLVYIVLLVVVLELSYRYGKSLPLKWLGWKPLIIPIGLYLLAVALQLQTTLMSPNLVGSDIHLEYFISNLVLEQGFWNPAYMGTTLNASLGLTLLLPVYKLLTGLSLILVFKVIAPMVFAVLPLVLYRIFRMQFSTIVSVLAVVFFITMPMFTMDTVQLIRQQQSELFFVLILLVVLDGNLSLVQKMILGIIFTIGVITTHLGIAIGLIGYLLVGSVMVLILVRLWRDKVDDALKPNLERSILLVLAIVSIGIYAGYYGWVNTGKMITSITIPVAIVENTAKQAVGGVGMGDIPKENAPEKSVSGVDEVVKEGDNKPSSIAQVASNLTLPKILANIEDEKPIVNKRLSLLVRFPFLDPFTKEPLAQTAIGLDFGKASVLGKVWRILQYLVEVCLVVGFFKLLFRPSKQIRIEYEAFVVASGFVLVGMYLLTNYGWGLGATRVWGITLLFMSPLFVIGAGTVGRWAIKFRGISENRIMVFSTLALLIPYFIFNSGVVFEVAKLKPVGFIDVPYSIALSGYRVDIASIFTEQDVVAMDWLKERIAKEESTMIYADVHGGNLVVQRIGAYLGKGKFKNLWQMGNDDVGYIFLRKWNVDNNMLTAYKGYGTRQSYGLDDYEVAKQKVEGGVVVFDNGARVILVTK